MKIKPARPAEESKTIKEGCNLSRIQNYVMAAGVVVIVGWFASPLEFRQRVSDRAMPILGASLPAIAILNKWRLQIMEDGRIDVGDLFTVASEIGPNIEDVAASVQLSPKEFERFKRYEQAIANGDELERLQSFEAGGIVGASKPNQREGAKVDSLSRTLSSPSETMQCTPALKTMKAIASDRETYRGKPVLDKETENPDFLI